MTNRKPTEQWQSHDTGSGEAAGDDAQGSYRAFREMIVARGQHFNDLLAAQGSPRVGRPDILVDENMSSYLIKTLRGFGFRVIDIKRSRMFGSPDDDIYRELSGMENIWLVTHDRDFLNVRRFSPFAVPGVVVFPAGEQGGWEPTVLDKALHHFADTAGKIPSPAIFDYRRNGKLHLYLPPQRDDGSLHPARERKILEYH